MFTGPVDVGSRSVSNLSGDSAHSTPLARFELLQNIRNFGRRSRDKSEGAGAVQEEDRDSGGGLLDPSAVRRGVERSFDQAREQIHEDVEGEVPS